MCSYTPLFPTNLSTGDPVYGVHWCDAGKRRRKACPMPSYDMPTPTRSLSPSDPVIVKSSSYGYDYADARPRRLERRYTTSLGLDFDIAPPAPPRLSRKHTHSGGSGDRDRKRMYIDDSSRLGLRFVKPGSSSSSRRKDRDPVVIVDKRDRERERERSREKEEERRRRRDDFELYPSSKSSRRLSREGLLGRSSTGLTDDFFTSTSRIFDAVPKGGDYYAEEDAHRHRRSYHRSGASSRYHDDDSRRYKLSSSSRHHHNHSHHHHDNDRRDRDRGGYVVEKATSSHRPGRSTRYVEEHLNDPVHLSDLDRAEEELGRQRKRTSGAYSGKLPADEGFFEPYKPREPASSKRHSVGSSHSRADLDKAYDEYEKAMLGQKKYSSDKKYSDDKYADRKHADDKYAAEKAAAKSKYSEDRYADKEGGRPSSSSSASKYAGAGAAAAAAALAPKVFDATSRFDELEKSGKFGDFDLDQYEKEKGYDKYAVKDPRYDDMDKYDKAGKYDRADKYDKADRYDKYDKYDKYDRADKYDKTDKHGKDTYDSKFDGIDGDFMVEYGSSSKRSDSETRKLRRTSSSSSYHKPTVEDIVDDEQLSQQQKKRSSRYGPDELEPLFSSPTSSPPSTTDGAPPASSSSSKRDRERDREREAREDLDSSSLKISDADRESMLERRLEVARMRAEILRMKEMQEVEDQAARMRRSEGRYERDDVKAIEAPRERERDDVELGGLRRSSSLRKSVSWGDAR